MKSIMKQPQNKEYIKKYTKLLTGLLNLSVQGLQDMYLPEKFEFAMKKKMVNGKVVIEGENLRYSLINLLGLHKAESHDIPIKINLKEIVQHQLNKVDTYNGVGEIGLLLWATSLISPEKIKLFLPKINFNNILATYNDAKLGNTMELSWLLTGLLLASTFDKNFKNSIGSLPVETYNRIRQNYGGQGVFRHEAKISINGKLRGKIGSFADQVYPIYAFSLYSQQMNNEEALMISKDCAQKMCEHQGEQGQWMWHYNAETGNVVSKFPVYSVHQDAMAPFTLFAVQKATGVNFEKYIYKGLDWLEKNNELNANMIDWENNAVWRRIAQPNSKRKTKLLASLIGINLKDNYKELEVLYESWSYHLGWILFAFAGRVDTKEIKEKNEEFLSKSNLKIFNLN
jgi:hypothetical protein